MLHGWVEVTHCAESRPRTYFCGATSAGAAFEPCVERFGSWMYWAPGSGIWYNVRKLASYDNHSDAVARELRRGCAKRPCLEELKEVFEMLRKKRGVTTVMFRKEVDQSCGNVAVELVDLHSDGRSACPIHDAQLHAQSATALREKSAGAQTDQGLFRAGWHASLECHCQVRSGSCATCANMDHMARSRLANKTFLARSRGMSKRLAPGLD